MSAREILIALISTIMGGVAVWIVQQVYLNRRENKRLASERIIKLQHSNKVITDAIFIDLAPRKSIALMNELLGAHRNTIVKISPCSRTMKDKLTLIFIGLVMEW